jgi:phage tail-like protein
MTAAAVQAHGVSRFVVDVANKPIGAFTSIRGLEAQVDYLEYREGGLNTVVHRLPGQIRYPNLVLSQGLTVQGELESWLARGGLGPKLQVVIVTLQDENGAHVRSWSFADAYPVRWTGPVLSAEGGVLAGEELEIAHKGFLA